MRQQLGHIFLAFRKMTSSVMDQRACLTGDAVCSARWHSSPHGSGAARKLGREVSSPAGGRRAAFADPSGRQAALPSCLRGALMPQSGGAEMPIGGRACADSGSTVKRLAGHNRGGVDDVHRRCLARRRQRLPSAMVAAVVHIAPAAEPGAASVSAETRHERQRPQRQRPQRGGSVRTSCGKNRTRCWWPPRRPCPPGGPRTRVDSSAHARMVRLRERGNGNGNRNGQTCASLSAKCSLDTPSRWLSSSNRLASILNLAAISCKPAVRGAGGARQPRERSR